MSRAKARKMRLMLNRCRELWNEFDPIGVLDDADGPRDEYDSYLPQTVKYVTSNPHKLTAYVRHTVQVNMGMTGFPEAEIEEFVERVKEELGA